MRVVIDTNVLLVCLSPRSEGHWLWQSLLSEAFAHYLVSEDRHIRIIRQYPYLGIELVSLSEFKEKLHNG